jgi:D-tyrosyl-tRNA(Tyr) deacylase
MTGHATGRRLPTGKNGSGGGTLPLDRHGPLECQVQRDHARVRAVVQRVSAAFVTVAGEEVGRIGRGLCVLLGVTHGDDAAVARKVADRLWHLRVFDDDDGVMNRSAADIGAELLVVSQFTVYGDTSTGRRPSWIAAARPEQAEPLVEEVVVALRRLGATVATGRFRTTMAVTLTNDGPVTVLIDR